MNRSVTVLLLVCGLWFAAGCSQSDSPDFRVTDRFEVGPQVYVRSMAVEPQRDALWVGTSVGVLEIDLAKRDLRSTFTRDDGLANEYVFAIGVDSQGYKWFGTNAGGVSRYRAGEWRTFFPMHGLADYWVYAFAGQTDDAWWIGTWDGANRVKLPELSFETFREQLVNEWVYGLAVDSRSRVWFGTEGGVSMLDGERWQHWTHEDGLGAANTSQLPASPNTGLGTRSRHDLDVTVEGSESFNPNYVFTLYVDRDDAVWAGTWGGGAARFDGTEWRNLTVANGLAGNIVYAIAQHPDGAYWFGTNHGLSRYDGKEFINYGPADGLLDENVYALAVPASGEIWAGTRHGAVVFEDAAP